jgi:predicted amidohydrolase YtcJ
MKRQITLLHNANVITLAEGSERASALAVQGGKIIAVGASPRLVSEFEGQAQRIDMQQRVLIPGLTDAHIHLHHYALSLQKVDCETRTRQECLERVARRASETPPGRWILGHGWNQNNWDDGFGSAVELDQAAPNNPVYLTAKSLHAAWANSYALRLAQVQAATPDPPDGRIGRDDTGEPDGILFETAMELVGRVVPASSIPKIEQAIASAIPTLWRFGLTSVHDFDRRECFQALQSLAQGGNLRLRVVKSLPLEDLPHAAALGLRSGFGDDFLRIGSIKAFADGALGPHTAAMLQPYEEDPQNRGILMLDAEELFERGRQAVESGLSLAVHAIGDRANHEILNAYAQLRNFETQLASSAAPRLRHRIEHVQIVHPDDAHRLAELDIIASMQPIHATSDMSMADRYWGSRAALSYAWRAQQQAGAVLAFGSDAPVESPNPFWGLHAAVTRRRQDGSPGPDGWYPEQRMSLEDALRAFTSGPAYAAGLEDRLGRLAPGYLADLIVLERDPFKVPQEEIPALQPIGTMIDGEWVWRDF